MSRGERDALILRLLSQILIKLHAGRQWGLDEAGVLALTKEAESVAEASERPHARESRKDEGYEP